VGNVFLLIFIIIFKIKYRYYFTKKFVLKRIKHDISGKYLLRIQNAIKHNFSLKFTGILEIFFTGFVWSFSYIFLNNEIFSFFTFCSGVYDIFDAFILESSAN